MGQPMKSGSRRGPDNLKTDAQRCIRRHGSVVNQPRIGGFAGQVFGYETEIVVLYAGVEDSSNIDVIDLADGFGARFKFVAPGRIDRRQRQQLEHDRLVCLSIDRFVGDRCTGASCLLRFALRVAADSVPLKEKFAFHKSPSDK